MGGGKMLREIKNSLIKMGVIAKPAEDSYVKKAVAWVKEYDFDHAGIFINHKRKHVWPLSQETGGYMIASLYNYGEKELAYRLAKWEVSQQLPSGAAAAMDKVPYTFDTAQVILGFLAVLDDMPEIEVNLRKACDYVDSKIAKNGEVLHDTLATWALPDGSMLSEYGNLYCLQPMLFAGQKLKEQKYIDAARRGMDFYRKKPDLVEFKPSMSMLSHYLGYMMEALVDLGEVELAKKGLKQASDMQKPDGSIPAYPGVDWVCSTCSAQLSIAWYKLGMPETANKAMSYMESLQNPSGGFYGGYGKKALYFPKDEISWAAKFYIDAYLLRTGKTPVKKG
jgi:malonyl-CoA O-methyltransferase